MAETFREGRSELAECPRCHGSGNIVVGDSGVDETIRLYLAGTSKRDIAAMQGLHEKTVARRLRVAGIPRRPVGWSG